MPELHLTLANELPQIRHAAAALEAFACEHGIPARLAAQLTLALDEVLTNLVSYGFPGGGRHEILVNVRLADGRISLSVRDDGIPFDPLDIPGPDLGLAIEERRIGGLGIHFVRTIMDEVRYARDATFNILTMHKVVDTADGAEARAVPPS